MDKTINNIIRISKEKGLSHENIAFELNISQPAYTKLLQNKTKPNLLYIVCIELLKY